MAAEASVITRVKPFSRSVEWRMRSRPAPRRACALCLFSRSPFRSGQWTLHSSVSVAVVTISGFQKQRGPLFSTEEAGDPGPPGLQSSGTLHGPLWGYFPKFQLHLHNVPLSLQLIPTTTWPVR
ncbi:hypothetical protein FKM82_018417 [Ascaphus truei]